MSSMSLAAAVSEDIMSNSMIEMIAYHFKDHESDNQQIYVNLREEHVRQPINHHLWLDDYHDIIFFQLYRMKRGTFDLLLQEILRKDSHYNIIMKRHSGGRESVQPSKGLLVFLRYMASQETLHSLGETFNLVPSTVMSVVNSFLFIVLSLKNQYIRWPRSGEEIQYITDGFQNYPNTLGAIDGTHVRVKVPLQQQDSYIDRFHNHSYNLLGICTYEKIFTYVFVGYPGSAHDSRVSFCAVFSNSQFVANIEERGSQNYFPGEEFHIIGDSAFPLRPWLMKPYRRTNIMTPRQRYHNTKLSKDRVRIENTFSSLKIRWSRLAFINVYSMSKAIEIGMAACVLHNFCYMNHDGWPEDNPDNDFVNEENGEVEMQQVAEAKRNDISNFLWENR